MVAPIPDYSKVSLLLPMSGANGGVTFTDYSPTSKTVSLFGNAKTITAQSKYYGSSGSFDGVGDRLSIASHADFNLGTGDFTIGFWFRRVSSDTEPYSRVLQLGPDNTNGTLFVFANAATGTECRPYVAGYSGAGVMFVEPGASPTTQDEWHHLEVDRSGSDWFLWIDGASAGVGSYAGYNVIQNAAYIGSNNTGVREFAGQLQDMYIIKGQALHTTPFTPPPRLIGSISTDAANPVRDDAGAPAIRSIVAFPRTYPSKLVTTTSASDGSFALTGLPATDYSVVYLDDDAGTLHNDLVHRVIPA